jgi:aspartate racemase
MKTIGVLGGLGPQATMDFEARVHRVAQGKIPPHMNGGYPPMVVWYHRRPPFVIDEQGHPRMPIEPDAELLDAARRVGATANFLVIPSHGPHLFQSEIERASARPVLSIIDVTLDEVRRRGWKRVGVLTLGPALIYTQRLDSLGIAWTALGAEKRERLDGAIFRLMEGGDGDATRQVARAAVEELRAKTVDGIILGCTELPLLLREMSEDPDLINPTQLLAEAAVRRAIE